MKRRSEGFTLAEVLITLGIVGVIASLIIPRLMVKYDRQAKVAKLKKVYTIYSQVHEMTKNDNGPVENFGWTSDTGYAGGIVSLTIFNKYYRKYFNIIKDCGTGSGCFGTMYKKLDGTNDANYNLYGNSVRMILNDGVSLRFMTSYKDCISTNRPRPFRHCGYFGADINGPNNGPNQRGIDYFEFYITPDGLIPVGAPSMDEYAKCSKQNDLLAGVGCTAWVIMNGNMNYLDYDTDVDWNKAPNGY